MKTVVTKEVARVPRRRGRYPATASLEGRDPAPSIAGARQRGGASWWGYPTEPVKAIAQYPAGSHEAVGKPDPRARAPYRYIDGGTGGARTGG